MNLLYEPMVHGYLLQHTMVEIVVCGPGLDKLGVRPAVKT